jgi:hypothetical protein
VWVSPYVGLEVVLDPPNGFYFSLSGSVGGFGIGSDVTVAATASASYFFARWFSLRAGWRLFYSLVTPDSRLLNRLEVLLHGPSLALVFTI